MLRYFSSTNRLAGGALAAAVLVGGIFSNKRKTSQVEPTIRPDGEAKDTTTLLLETGSKLFQSSEPLAGTHIYFVGFHPMKDDPCHQMEAHHYCKQVNEDFAQCVLFDGNTKNANLTGLEYIISDKLFNQLPSEEKKYWHPHNYEILSGQLVAPGLPSSAEKKLMKKKMNSYGKTFHTWRAKCWEGEKPFMDTLPKGEAILAWSFNHDGEVKEDLVVARDTNMGLVIEEIRKEKEYLHSEKKTTRGN
eukprot:TRINITY_DN7337_c0_g1_i1.p1 TRINITY_DN7337_c0_g1~~TRINITY_DN7337_c0_g1_i1.p1  ORF type:complete len:247 (+),score=69.12 TRINITY_DN7337_c0_g1_i1:100-840(+)